MAAAAIQSSGTFGRTMDEAESSTDEEAESHADGGKRCEDEESVTGAKTRFIVAGIEDDAHLVSLDSLMRFVFPAGLQHPLSTGRLYAFGFYGPLDSSAQLRSGQRGAHVVARWELDAMCAQFEREDVLQVYILPGRPLAALSERQQDELIAQADQRIKAQTGKGLMPQLTRAEVSRLFDEVHKVRDQKMRFHEMQRQIIDFRAERVKRLKVMYPNVTRAPPPGLQERLARAHQKSDGVSFSLVGGTGEKRRSRRSRVSADVAPPEMFLKNKGMSDTSVSSHTNKILATRAFKICDIEAGNSPELTSNVRLIRSDRRDRELAEPWDTKSKNKTDEYAKLRMLTALRYGRS